jgi:hypothetical protein
MCEAIGFVTTRSDRMVSLRRRGSPLLAFHLGGIDALQDQL